MRSLKSPIIQPGSGRSRREMPPGWGGTRRRKAVPDGVVGDQQGLQNQEVEGSETY